MSYILDALRRANSERERGNVPTLLSDPGPADLTIDEDDAPPVLRESSSRQPLLIGGLAAGVLVLLGVVWLMWPAPRSEAPPPVVSAPVAPAPQPAAPPTVTAATVPLNVPPLVQQQPAPAPAPAPPKPAEPNAVVPTRENLPPELRAQLPALTTGGAMYSDTPASRMLIINGQLFREGDKVAPELVLEQIQLRGAVLAFRGQRFTIAY